MWLQKILDQLHKTSVTEAGGRLFVSNYHQYLYTFFPKRALLSYLPASVVAELRGEPTNRFSNEGIAREWPRVLNELGYIVDIMSWDDTGFQPTKKYDVVVLHGGKNFTQVYGRLQPKPPFIHFLTGTYWKFNNAQEEQRRLDFAKRHGVEVPRDRHIAISEDVVNEAARGIIVIGNQRIRETYAKYPVVEPLNNASYPDDYFETSTKNYAEARKHFLFFAGAGNIHKGLDLVIDAFRDLDAHLHIMTVPDKEVIDVFAKELQLPNIHMVGEVPMRTPLFYETVNKCAFQILPSCSEGQPGSVVECMYQGLIPIVSKESGLDAEGYGVVLGKNNIREIQTVVRKLANLSPTEVEKMAKKARQVATTQHTPEKFRHDLKQAITTILEK